MKRMLLAAVAAVLALNLGALVLFNPQESPVQAQGKEKVEKVANLEEFLKADETWAKADTVGKCEYLTKLCDKDQRITYDQKRWMQYRVLMEQAKKDGIDKDIVKLLGWAGGIMKDYKNPLQKAAYSALDEIVRQYGTRRLYDDEAYKNGDIKGKLKRLKELWEARELGQSETYALGDSLVFRYLASANGKIDEEIKLMSELISANLLVWDNTARIQFGLMQRALYEKPELTDNTKRMKWLGEIADQKTGKLSWMMVGNMRLHLLLEMMGTDEEFLKLDYAGRAAKIDGWAKEGLIGSSEVSALKAAYAATK